MLLNLSLRYSVRFICAALLLMAAIFWQGSKLGTEFMPQLDEGDIALHALRIPGTSLLIFGLLFTALNSAKDALVVFSGVPLALTGGVAALLLRDMPLSISAAIGFIALSGIAVLNGVVMLAMIKQLREQGLVLHQAIVQGALQRLRPVLITTPAALAGVV
ncbi:efflux RND transporter permease subunit [Rheinheimera sp.]|uniref:efflux RND transporter permease subunit n=1 Tax=Rheinheimera sp. TaxID=1869214 RepID=UPI0040478143